MGDLQLVGNHRRGTEYRLEETGRMQARQGTGCPGGAQNRHRLRPWNKGAHRDAALVRADAVRAQDLKGIGVLAPYQELNLPLTHRHPQLYPPLSIFIHSVNRTPLRPVRTSRSRGWRYTTGESRRRADADLSGIDQQVKAYLSVDNAVDDRALRGVPVLVETRDERRPAVVPGRRKLIAHRRRVRAGCPAEGLGDQPEGIVSQRSSAVGVDAENTGVSGDEPVGLRAQSCRRCFGREKGGKKTPLQNRAVGGDQGGVVPTVAAEEDSPNA